MPEYVLDHFAVGVWKFDDALPVVEQALGGRRTIGGPGDGAFEWRTWVLRGGGQVEIIVPAGPPDGFLHRFLKSRGPGIHHVTFYVPELREACELAEANGYRVVGYDPSSRRWQEAFLFPKDALGIVVQLTGRRPEGAGPPTAARPVREGPAHAARLVGLRMAAPSAEAARKLWEHTLFGEADERDGEIVFRWPQSPARIAVTIDPELPVGPLSLEVETDRAADRIDRDPAPEFGARLTRAHD